MTSDFTLDLPDEAATIDFGAALAKAITPGLAIYLHGDLGAGKTTLVRGLLHGLGYAGKVKVRPIRWLSPTRCWIAMRRN